MSLLTFSDLENPRSRVEPDVGTPKRNRQTPTATSYCGQLQPSEICSVIAQDTQWSLANEAKACLGLDPRVQFRWGD